MTISFHLARADNGVIGRDGTLPWHRPADLRRFKAQTLGRAMIMGRKTFDAMGVLPGRRSIVVTRQAGWSGEGVETASSLDHALAMVGDDDVFIVGGAQIYEQALPFADRILLTEIDVEVDGDTYFPTLTSDQWRETSCDPQDGFAWVTYERAVPRATLVLGDRVGRGARAKIGASVAVIQDGRLLVTRREDNSLWCLPGGGIDPGETFAEAAIREAYEETGIQVEVESLIGVYTDPDIVIRSRGGSAHTQIYGVCFRARLVSGTPGLSEEVTEVAWVDVDEASRLPFIPLHRRLVKAAFGSPDAPPIFV